MFKQLIRARRQQITVSIISLLCAGALYLFWRELCIGSYYCSGHTVGAVMKPARIIFLGVAVVFALSLFIPSATYQVWLRNVFRWLFGFIVIIYLIMTTGQAGGFSPSHAQVAQGLAALLVAASLLFWIGHILYTQLRG